MRKVRDFDAELKALNERARLLQQRKVQQFGELVEATGADALDADVLAGALLAAVAEQDIATIAAWGRKGAQFFRDTRRKSSRRARGGGEGDTTAAPGAEPA
ncbi:conjugal transfer protein TraD [Sphingomonas sp. CL5.1]|uniref:conjugal transfer protein TraD n=1 Tax=Sphingomonas sp. CL5.1 TaxID=2653203 RepID=UPI00158193F4|nr:conjugal transfer protein TraD [Sphingomonas sp. CL5.1]QKR98285.1 conjugal transfer protein TraD [Sphingomonas sp. CL5.1]